MEAEAAVNYLLIASTTAVKDVTLLDPESTSKKSSIYLYLCKYFPAHYDTCTPRRSQFQLQAAWYCVLSPATAVLHILHFWHLC